MQSYCWRIIHQKSKLIVVILLVTLPQVQVFQTWITCKMLGLDTYSPMYATFLSLPGVAFHIVHKVYMWFLPLYLLTVFAEIVLEETETHLSNSLICRVGKGKYIVGHIKRAFIATFVLIMVALLINMVLCALVFSGGSYLGLDPSDSPENLLYVYANAHPVIANFFFSVVVALLGALICCVGVAISFVVPNRKIVYSVCLMLWLVPVASKKSLMLAFQPFSEYDYNTVLPIIAIAIVSYLLIIVFATYWKWRSDEL